MQDLVAKPKNRIQKLRIFRDKKTAKRMPVLKNPKVMLILMIISQYLPLFPNEKHTFWHWRSCKNQMLSRSKLPSYISLSQANCWELPSVMLVTKTIPSKWLLAVYDDSFMHSMTHRSKDRPVSSFKQLLKISECIGLNQDRTWTPWHLKSLTFTRKI